MFKISVLYNNPENPSEFDRYYKEKHMPLVNQIEGLLNFELTRVLRGPGGSPTDYYLLAELYFRDEAQMHEAMGSPEGQATVDDLANFAAAGVQIMIGNSVEW